MAGNETAESSPVEQCTADIFFIHDLFTLSRPLLRQNRNRGNRLNMPLIDWIILAIYGVAMIGLRRPAPYADKIAGLGRAEKQYGIVP